MSRSTTQRNRWIRIAARTVLGGCALVAHDAAHAAMTSLPACPSQTMGGDEVVAALDGQSGGDAMLLADAGDVFERMFGSSRRPATLPAQQMVPLPARVPESEAPPELLNLPKDPSYLIPPPPSDVRQTSQSATTSNTVQRPTQQASLNTHPSAAQGQRPSTQPARMNPAVQQHLESLYARDGRQMPQVQFDASPVQTPAGQRAAHAAAQQGNKTARVPSAASSPHLVPQPAQESKSSGGLLGWLFNRNDRSQPVVHGHVPPPAAVPHSAAQPKPQFVQTAPVGQPGAPFIPPGPDGLARPSDSLFSAAPAPVSASSVDNSENSQDTLLEPVPVPSIELRPIPHQVAASKEKINFFPDDSSQQVAEVAPPTPAEEPATQPEGTWKPRGASSQTALKPADSPFTGLTLGEKDNDASETPTEPVAEQDAPKLLPAGEATAIAKNGEKTKPAPRQDPRLQLIAARTDRTGLKGFCPVALRDDRALVDAEPQYVAEFDGRSYFLSSAGARSKFLADPAAYAPAGGGLDVVALKDGTEREGSLDHAAWYKGRLHLFASEESLKTFTASPGTYCDVK